MKILILGSSGILGNFLSNNLKSDFKIIHNGIKSRKIDLSNFDKFQNLLLNTKPDFIINCVALTDIDECEKNKKKSYKINFEIVKNLFFILKKYKFKTKVIQISTDQFYNNKNKKLNVEKKKLTLNYYSKTKFFAEKICLKHNSIVLRTNFFGKSLSKNKSFTDWIYSAFSSNKKFFLVNDIFFSPINLETLTKIIKIIIKKKKINGIFNLGSKDVINKKTFAIKFAKLCNIYNNNYLSIKSKKVFKVKRPKFMGMNLKNSEKILKIKFPKIDTILRREAKKYI